MKNKIYLLHNAWVFKDKHILQYCVAKNAEDAWKIFSKKLGITNENLYVIKEVDIDFLVSQINELIGSVQTCKQFAKQITNLPICSLSKVVYEDEDNQEEND